MNKKRVILIVVILVFIAGYVGAKQYTTAKARKEIDRNIARLSAFGDINYENVEVSVLGDKIIIKDVTITPASSGNKIKVKKIIINDIDKEHETPAFMSLALKGMEMNFDDMPPKERKTWEDLGYKKNVFADLQIDYKYDLEKKDLKINGLEFSADKLGAFKASIHIGNIYLDRPESIIGLIFTWPGIMIYGASISYEDDSLAQRCFQVAAAREGKSVSDIKKEIIRDIKSELAASSGKVSQMAAKAVIDFIKKPDKLSIKIEPENPIPLGKLSGIKNPEDVIKLLRLKIES